MKEEMEKTIINFERDGFRTNLAERVLEPEEIITGAEGEKYANRVDDRTLSYSMVAQDIVERLGVNKDSKLIEVCCGSGQLAHFIKNLTGAHIVATDGGRELVEAAIKKYGNEGIEFRQLDVHSAEDADFDFVICKDSFHHFTNAIESIKDMFRLLKKGGKIYIFDLVRSCDPEQIDYRQKKIQVDAEARRFLQSVNASLTPEEMEKVFASSGVAFSETFYPLFYSDENIKLHDKEIEIDSTKEYLLDKLFAVYVLTK